MTQTLFQYYERELHYQREQSRSFAARYPAAAGRLRMDAAGTGDPHVERLIQAVSLVGARIHKRLDDDLPEVTDALLSILYPHYLRPIPSMAIVQFGADAGNIPPEGLQVPRGTMVRATTQAGIECRYRTTQTAEVWPCKIVSADFLQPPYGNAPPAPPATQSALRLRIRNAHNQPWSALQLQSLRLHLTGPEPIAASLYECLVGDAEEVVFIAADGKPRSFPATEVLQPVGFGRDTAMLPYPEQSFDGYRLLTELFTFPDKFQFVDLSGFAEMDAELPPRDLELWVFFRRPHLDLCGEVRASTIRLGCTPVVNLYDKICEPIQFTRRQFEYPVVPDVAQRLGSEVYSIDQVLSSHRDQAAEAWRPFFDLRRRQTPVDAGYWHTVRRDGQAVGDQGTDVFLQLVDADFDPCMPASEVVTVKATCTDRDRPCLLRQHGNAILWQVEGPVPVTEVQCLKHPTVPLRPPTRRHAHWNLISHLSLNHRFLEGPGGLDTLKEMLSLYDFSDPDSYDVRGAACRQMISGILEMRHRKIARQVGPAADGCFARGSELTIVLDEEQYEAVGGYLFAAVLHHFFGLASGINSFVETVAESKQRDGRFARFSPLAGEEPLL